MWEGVFEFKNMLLTTAVSEGLWQPQEQRQLCYLPFAKHPLCVQDLTWRFLGMTSQPGWQMVVLTHRKKTDLLQGLTQFALS